MIKSIETNEVKSILFLGRRFFDEANLPGSFVPEIAEESWCGLISRGIGKIFVYYSSGNPVGAIGVIITKDIHDGEKVAEEGFWFVDPTSRGVGIKLFQHAETYAKKSGCKRMAMVHIIDLHPEKLQRFYERSGYRCVEKAYHKQL